MKKAHLLTINLCFLLVSVLAQEGIDVGQKFTINSDNLEQEIELQIYLPNGYKESVQDYPTLYILDGQWYFLNGVAIQESIRGDRHMPKMIVIGINMVDRPYRTKLFDRWDSLIAFIESELVPYIDNSYRTSTERVIFGWEQSGFLVSEIILRNNSPFNCAITSSGSYINEKLSEDFKTEHERFFFIAGSEKDIYSINDSNQAAEALGKLNPDNLTWKYQLFNEEIHESLGYTSLYQGLKFFYHNYGSLVFSNIEEFRNKGGIPYLTHYFKERGERFNLPTEIDESTKNSLIWLAWKKDDFAAFDLFMNEFQDVLSTPRYASAYWQNRLAQFYLKNDSYDKAIEYFNRGIIEYPSERYLAEMYHGLGKAYMKKGETKMGKKNFKKAVESAKVTSDSKLEFYRQQLNSQH